MQFSNTITKNGIIQRIEDHAQIGDGVVSGDDTLLKKMTSNVNETVFDLTTEIMILMDDFDWEDPNRTDINIATTPLVANQRDYEFDNIDFLKLKRLDVTYDGVNYYRATPFDSAAYFGERGLGNDTVTDQDFNKTKPMYDPKGSGFWLYPRASASDVTAGAKARIEYARAFEEFVYTDTIKQPPIDRNFHDLVAIGACLKWPQLPADIYNKKSIEFAQGLERFRKHYSKRNEDRFLTFATNLNSNYK
jgi:hypothetical protein